MFGWQSLCRSSINELVKDLDQDLLLVKLHVCGFQKTRLELVYSYDRRHGTKTIVNFSAWAELLELVPQGSMGSRIKDYYFFLPEYTEVCNSTENTTSM